MVGREIKKRLIENAYIAVKFGCKVDKVPSTKCNNLIFKFHKINDM